MNRFPPWARVKGMIRFMILLHIEVARLPALKRGKRSIFTRIYIVLGHNIMSSFRKHNNFQE